MCQHERPTRPCFVTMGISVCLKPVWVRQTLTVDREEEPCIIKVYSSEDAAKGAVDRNNEAFAELQCMLEKLDGDDLYNFLKSQEAARLNAQITGEEWYEVIEFQL